MSCVAFDHEKDNIVLYDYRKILVHMCNAREAAAVDGGCCLIVAPHAIAKGSITGAPLDLLYSFALPMQTGGR